MTFPLPVKVAYCLFCLCVHLFPGGEEGALFLYDVLMEIDITRLLPICFPIWH